MRIQYKTYRAARAPASVIAARYGNGILTKGSSNGENDRDHGGGERPRKGGHHLRVRRAGGGDQPALFRVEEARQHHAPARAPCRRRLAHGGRIYPRAGRQHRRVHRHLGTGGHRHDHRPVCRLGGLGSDPVHHRTGAARTALQGRLPGGGHRVHRQARDQMGGDRARTGPGSARLPAGVSSHAFGASRPGADRPSFRRADGRDRVRSGYLRATPGLQAARELRTDRKSAGDAGSSRTAADRRRRRHYQCRCRRLAGRVRRDHRRARDSDPDGLGSHSGRSPVDGRHGRPADQPSLRQRDHAGLRLRSRHRQPLGQPPHRIARGLYQGPQVRSRRHRTDPDRPRIRAGLRHRLGRGGRHCGCSWMSRSNGVRPAASRTDRHGSRNAARARLRCCARRTSTARR